MRRALLLALWSSGAWTDLNDVREDPASFGVDPQGVAAHITTIEHQREEILDALVEAALGVVREIAK